MTESANLKHRLESSQTVGSQNPHNRTARYACTCGQVIFNVGEGSLAKSRKEFDDHLAQYEMPDAFSQPAAAAQWTKIDDAFDARQFFGKTMQVVSEMTIGKDGELTLTEPTHYRLKDAL